MWLSFTVDAVNNVADNGGVSPNGLNSSDINNITSPTCIHSSIELDMYIIGGYWLKTGLTDNDTIRNNQTGC